MRNDQEHGLFVCDCAPCRGRVEDGSKKRTEAYRSVQKVTQACRRVVSSSEPGTPQRLSRMQICSQLQLVPPASYKLHCFTGPTRPYRVNDVR